MKKVAEEYGEKVIENPNNKISIAMSLTNICKDAKDKSQITFLGSLFYSRQVSGIRILAPSAETNFNGYLFKNYGTHSNSYPILPYVNFAAAIGITLKEIKEFITKFKDTVKIYQKSMKESFSKGLILDQEQYNTNDTDTLSKKDKKQRPIKKDKLAVFSISTPINLSITQVDVLSTEAMVSVEKLDESNSTIGKKK